MVFKLVCTAGAKEENLVEKISLARTLVKKRIDLNMKYKLIWISV